MKSQRSQLSPKGKRSVLVVEDEKNVANAICESFRQSPRYEFDISTATDPLDYIRKRYNEKVFDVCIMDLKLMNILRLSGNLITASKTREQPGSLVVAYSAYDDIRTVVAAMHAGATDFISKNECAPHELVGRVEAIFDERRRAVERRKDVISLYRKNEMAWQRKYSGKTIAIAGKRVVAVGRSRLEAMIKYDERRADHEKDPDWPETPEILEFSARTEEGEQ